LNLIPKEHNPTNHNRDTLVKDGTFYHLHLGQTDSIVNAYFITF